MDLAKDFVFQPLPAIDDGQIVTTSASEAAAPSLIDRLKASASGAAAAAKAKAPNPLGRLAPLKGTWEGTGFNTIWRPFFGDPDGQQMFLELNLTEETIEFQEIEGPIPNRGRHQKDIAMFGLSYLQQIKDKNLGAGLHFEPGIWAHVPATTHPKEGVSIVRMATIPHGTAIIAQGNSSELDVTDRPDIPRADIRFFGVGQPDDRSGDFPEMDLKNHSKFRTPAAGLVGITQKMVNDPNSVLRDAIAGQNITSAVRLDVSTEPRPVRGGGIANTAFLDGGTEEDSNATASSVTSTFWLEHLDNEPRASQLQYTQTVLLDFDGVSWPHVTVATLRRVA
jgi:hypothetical protein